MAKKNGADGNYPSVQKYDGIDQMTSRLVHTLGDGMVESFQNASQPPVGILMPSLALAFGVGCNVWPLSQPSEHIGPFGSGKTSWALEVMRWFAAFGGVGLVDETENKKASGVISSLYHPDLMQACKLAEANYMEQWQDVTSAAFGSFDDTAEDRYKEIHGKKRSKKDELEFEDSYDKKKSKKKEEPLRSYLTPLVVVVDSMMAVTSRRNIEAQQADGHADLVHPVDAGLLKSYFQALPSRMRHRPYSLLFINHYKPKKDFRGMTEHHSPGGFAGKFYAVMLLLMQRIRDIELGNMSGGMEVSMQFLKSCFGESRKTFRTRILWKKIKVAEGQYRQVSWWDWGWTTANFLIDITKDDATLRGAVGDIVDLRPAKGGRVWSKVLGIPESDPQSYSTVGKLIDRSPAILQSLYQQLLISEGAGYQAGMDYHHVLQNRRSYPWYAVDYPYDRYSVEDADLVAAANEEAVKSGAVK